MKTCNKGEGSIIGAKGEEDNSRIRPTESNTHRSSEKMKPQTQTTYVIS